MFGKLILVPPYFVSKPLVYGNTGKKDLLKHAMK